ncbi:hypothetical protein PAESOLCIP111_04560 [Paenibacillus solanacearum]|uniref:Rv2525c-like glycoside hydrolase-like domain-containing protein n=1 Tax=Paenibacillus solanacearum TaxID=2048548 RepID=A0A916K7H1_9BACL|nr:DUF1906 domain-containing protein [Paenibacillus solanacearum]CAG7643806.1 hypothetical protein PAESOLCIP111_04560 [Paenibacillus solanacearum]
MAKGFDCSTPLTAETAALFAADGYSFVCRYLVPSGWKRLTAEEAAVISEAGLNIVSVFETTANRPLGGRSAGLADGATAAQTAYSIGQPPGSTIYFAVDFDATSNQMQTVIDYIRAASEATPDFNTGVYGSYAVVEAVSASGACSRFWQTYAWSSGKLSGAAHLYQYRNNVQANGITIDLDESYGNEGWWNLMAEPLAVEDANQLIEILKGLYNAGIGQDEAHRLANALRRASGQPEE